MRVELTEEPPELWIGRLGFALDPISIRRHGNWTAALSLHPSEWSARERGYAPPRGLWPIFYFWRLGPISVERWLIDRQGWPHVNPATSGNHGPATSRSR